MYDLTNPICLIFYFGASLNPYYMPLPRNTHHKQKICCFIFILTFLTNTNTFSQYKKLAAQEDKLVQLYAKVASFHNVDFDSLELYSKKFERDFKRFIKSNPGTMQYDFKKLSKEENFCEIQTSGDGNFRIYSWDTETGGTQRVFKSICQWKGNGKVFTDIGDVEGDSREDDLCTNLYTVMIGNKPYYLAIKVSVGSSRDHGETISAYRIEGERLLDTVTVFKTKTETLNSIIVNSDHFNVVDDYNRNEGITYDEQQKIVYIPLVNDKGALTNTYLRYQLNGRYFEYIGTTVPDNQHVLFEDIKAKFQNEVTHQCDSIRTHFNDQQTKGRIAFLNKDFSTNLFSKNSSVAYWYCRDFNDYKKPHFEIVSILFKTDKDRDAALAKINASGRTNFIVKVLTTFKVKTFEHGLLIAYSETATSEMLKPFWDGL